ncbi:hypothetical protein B4147_1088 [Bacillus wiedmannii]|uniref:PD-(D/E)XK endonuclease-like domain-containing protein n=1 Tax=Bacillus wiedmannii TaxID=1890302 RepID=A0A0G8CNP8_9BACI|nr:hypothetical protein [Bacillus wiedmannii]KLA01421.1 hypothetical protein B4147_1088 [Bacillus wiedmannii]
MSVQVHTYSQPKGWEKHPLYASFPDAIHICATNNQKDGIQACYGHDLEHIYSFRKFIKALYVEWYSAETKFQQYLRLSKILASLQYKQPELKKAFRANAMDILENIRFFVESNIKPQDLKDSWIKTDKERVFKEVWTEFVQKDATIQAHYKALKRPILKKQLQDAINTLCDENNVKLVGDIHIVLHGFYFVTPEQQIILEILREQQIRITFFQYYDERYADTFDFIKAFVTNRFGWPSSEEWIYDKVSGTKATRIAHAFLSSYEGKSAQQSDGKKKVTSYGSFFDFLHDVILPHFPIEGRAEGNVSIISPNAEGLNELLMSYYPELNHKKRNFLSYPIGRFLLSLHQIYKNGQLYLTDEILRAQFSSGWLYDESTRENAQNYTYELEQLFPYLQGCKEITDWISHLDQLINQGLTIEKAFPIREENRIIRSVRSPFSKISHFAVPLECVKQIRCFIQKIREMTEVLFAHSDSNTIEVHFNRLKAILKKHGKGVMLIANENEKLLIQELEKKISHIQDDSEFLYDDLQTALHFYLSGKLEDTDEEYINSFIEIDGEMFKSQEHTIYLTGLDENSLPLGAQSIPWPLQPDTFEKLSEQHSALELHTIRIRANKFISRYLFFIALNLPTEHVKLSWIKNILDQHELQPALYIKQLNLRAVDFTAVSADVPITYTPYDFSKETVNKNDIMKSWETLAFEDFLAEYKLCPKRFYYSYIADEYPTFSSDFMHQFIFSEIIRVAGQGSKADFEVVLEEVSVLFPQWIDFKKSVSAKMAFQYVPGQLGRKTAVTEEHSYTETRKNFQFPGFTKKNRDNLFDETKASLVSIVDEILSEDNKIMEANPSYTCRFCPHIDYCDDAVYSIDMRKEDD